MTQAYTSCYWIQHGINFEPDGLQMCCLCCHEGKGNLVIKENYRGEVFKPGEIFSLKEKFIRENKDNIINPKCKGCFLLQERQWDEEGKYISYIHFNHWTNCNSDCIYCYTSWDKANFNKKPHYNVVPALKEIFRQKLFRPGGEITFAGGEPTILKEFEEIIKLCLDNGADRITIHSSGIRYSRALERGIREKKITICLSADSGTRETYKKIKRVDKFNVFWENVKKYAKHQTDENDKRFVNTKYILIPGINTSKEEIDKWFELNEKSGIKTVTFDIETNYCRDLAEKGEDYPKELVGLAKYMIDKANGLNYNIIYYNNFKYLAYKNGFIDEY
ncbi:radical SAM protein [bacterium]|nr:radical SAM protein [bacterium]